MNSLHPFKKNTVMFPSVMILFCILLSKKRKINLTWIKCIYQLCTFWKCCISNNSLIIAALVVPACPVARRSHEIEPQPCPAAANARGYGTLQPVIPLALQKASDIVLLLSVL